MNYVVHGHTEDPMDIFIDSFKSQTNFFSCEVHGGSFIHGIHLISGYVIDKCVRYHIH